MTECHLGCRKINLTLFKSLNYSELKKNMVDLSHPQIFKKILNFMCS